MAFPDAWLDELLAKNDIVSVISSYVDLKPKGRRLWGLCPLHGEKTPSFSVSPDKQMFYCFGCHAGGTVIQFLMQMEHITFQEAVQQLAQRAGMTMPETENDAAMQRERAYKERLQEACKRAARYYMETLLSDAGLPGRQYLARRSISVEAVKRFGIGYAREGWDNLKNHLFQEGFTQQELLDAGLLVRNEKKGTVYDAYRGRVIFPIIAASGRVLGFGARVMDDSKPKYINTGDTPIYNKRNNLYGLNLQKGKRLEDLVMVEGYTDVIGLYEAGVTNAVASLGTALTIQQARLLKRYVPLVYIAYDGDAAGQNATIRGLDILSSEGIDVRVIVFPDSMDPDEFIRTHGREAFDKLKDEARSLNAFKIESMARSYDLLRENDRERFAIEACAFIAGLQPVEQGRHLSRLAQKTGYPMESLVSQIKRGGAIRDPYKTQNSDTGKWQNKRTAKTFEESARMRAEAMLLRVMQQSKEATLTAVSEGATDLLSDPVYETFASEIIAAYAMDTEPNCARIMSGMDPADAERIAAVLREDLPQSDPEKAVTDCIARLRKIDTEARLEELNRRLSDSTKSMQEKQDIMLEIQRLNRELRG